jgi:hypothetical protein
MVDSEALANLCAITGCDDATAIGLLQACDNKLEEAVNLYFASGGATHQAASSVGGSAQPPDIPPELLEEEPVRAPLPTKVERLYGEGPTAGELLAARRRQPPTRPQPRVDVFRSFKDGADGAPGGGSSQPSGT